MMLELILNNWGKVIIGVLCGFIIGWYLYTTQKIYSLTATKNLLTEQNSLQKQIIIQQKQQYIALQQQQSIIEAKLEELNQMDIQRQTKFEANQNEIKTLKQQLNLTNVITPQWLRLATGEPMPTLSITPGKTNAAIESANAIQPDRSATGINKFVEQCYAEQDRCNILREVVESFAVNYNKTLN